MEKFEGVNRVEGVETRQCKCECELDVLKFLNDEIKKKI